MKNKTTRQMMIVVLLLIAMISGGLVFKYFYSLYQADDLFAQMADAYHQGQIDSLDDGEYEEKEILPYLADMYAKNNDLAGWIRIEGTNIDYPLMHTPNEPEFYLKRDFNMEYSLSGTPFIEGKCTFNHRSDNIIIYAHNMKNGTMFAQLLRYREKDFWEANPIIDFSTLYQEKEYEIIAAFPTQVYGGDANQFMYYTFISAKSAEEYDRFISDAKKLSLYETGVSASYGDKLLTLSTCAYHADNGRFVIVAKEKGSI